MNEIIQDGKTGVLVKASQGPTMRNLLPKRWTQYFTNNKNYTTFLYKTYKASENDLYSSINRILKMSLEQKRELGENAFKKSRKEYEEFKAKFSKVVLDNDNDKDTTSKFISYTKKNSSIHKQKTIRIIFSDSPGLINDATIYKTEFLKQGYKVDFKLIDSVLHTTKTNKPKESYYNVNLFIEILPFKCKIMFPAKTNLFMPNNELFIDTNEDNKKYGKNYTYNRYEELKNIDFILCKTELCHTFFNFIKNEKYRNNIYNYQTIYTKFTSSISKEIKEIVDRDDYNDTVIDPNLFIHLAGKSGFKNTPDLVHCWIKNKGFLDIDSDIKLVITCYEDCSKWFNKILNRFFKYDFEKDPDVNMNRKTNIATYKNMTIYFKPVTPINNFIDIITKANVAICISNKEGYGHYINEARYMNKFIITLDYPPMNELVIDKNDKNGTGGIGGNGIVLKKKNKFIKQTYKETKFNFIEAYPDSSELRDSIIWCIKHKNELRKWGVNGRKMFLDDKKQFENSMEKFIGNRL